MQREEKAAALATMLLDEVIKDLKQHHKQFPDATFDEAIWYVKGMKATVQPWLERRLNAK